MAVLHCELMWLCLYRVDVVVLVLSCDSDVAMFVL